MSLSYRVIRRFHQLGLHGVCARFRWAFDGMADWLYDDVHNIRRPWEPVR